MFSCADVAELMDGVNDLSVTCRIVCKDRLPIANLTVRVLGSPMNITIYTRLDEKRTEQPFQADTRYIVRVEPDHSTVGAVCYLLVSFIHLFIHSFIRRGTRHAICTRNNGRTTRREAALTVAMHET